MKNLMVGLCLVLCAAFAHGQGLEGLIIEQYYVSDASDSVGSDANAAGTLPLGSITWRFYADLAPGYTLQAIYGVDVVPTGVVNAGDHQLRLKTSTSFFNNEDRCGTTANDINFNFVDDNTVMLDSWVSVGGAAGSKQAVRKALDDGTGTIVNNDGLLQNNDPDAGIPLTTQDGFSSSATAPDAVTLVGFGTELNVFNCTSQAGNELATYNASWASLTGAMGATAENEVLFAQVTTDGILDYCFNIQVGTPAGGVENYVAQNAVGNEIEMPMLKGTLNDCLQPFTTNIRPARATLNWPATVGATGYEIEGSEVGFSTITLTTGSATNLVATGLVSGKTYFYRVRPTAAGGSIKGEWSCYDTFSTCAPPTNLAVSNITDNSATLSYTPGPANVSYFVAGRPNPGGPSSVVTINNGMNTSLNATALLACQEYVWSVYAVCEGGSATAIASPNFFTTTGCPGAASKTELTDSKLSVQLAPNPAADHTKLLISGVEDESDVIVSIYDMAGKQIAAYALESAPYMSELDINTASFAKGLYQVVTTTESNIEVQKLVISK